MFNIFIVLLDFIFLVKMLCIFGGVLDIFNRMCDLGRLIIIVIVAIRTEGEGKVFFICSSERNLFIFCI